MFFETYEEQRRLYEESVRKYGKLLTAKEQLFSLTLPQAIDYGSEKVQTSGQANTIEEYIIKLQRSGIDKALKEAESIALSRKENLERARYMLEESSDLADRVYKMKFLYNDSVPKIALKLKYSEEQIYRILRKIRKNI